MRERPGPDEQIHPRVAQEGPPAMPTADPVGVKRMDPGELQTAREYLGLTTEALARMLGVRHGTVRDWESGRAPIPFRVHGEVERIEASTAAAVGEVVTALRDARDPVLRVYRTDAEMHVARPDLAHLPARWWRHVVARAVHEVPSVAIVSEGER